ncbi:MAG: hypothetical protein EOO02_18270 [Chitinophagaceae bacterium]|nr:MAG: hypothetical protein EOO02_18270 [Chitinophagaceae bacterium]
MATKDYGGDTTAMYSDSLVNAVRNFQTRHGMKATGIVTDSMISLLNIAPEERVQQILVNMNRALWMPPVTDSNRIEVNLPSQMLYVYTDSGKALEMPVIVGKEGDGTVMFTSAINQVVFNPSWNIPKSIVEEEILPKMKADAGYLKKNNMEVVRQNDSIPVLRQLPGKDNPLGEVKFLFPNTHDIYLHDTPDKRLFANNNRALSHGCIRVGDAAKLATFLLSNAQWNDQKVSAAMAANKEQTVKLDKAFPVAITYFTAYVTPSGTVSYQNDIYGHDKAAMQKMFL